MRQIISFLKTTKGKCILAAVALTIAALCIVLSLVLNRSVPVSLTDGSFSSVAIQAEGTAARGISADSTFLLTGGKGFDQAAVEKLVTFTPKQEFTVSKLSADSFRIKPSRTLDSNLLVTLTLSDEEGSAVKKWAFQTESTFEILSVLPSDESKNVPVNTGIEVRFSQTDIDEASFEAAFSIKPYAKGTFQKFRDTMVFVPEILERSTVYEVTVNNSVKNSAGETISSPKAFSFRTENLNQTILSNSGNITESFLPSDTPLFTLYVDTGYRDKKIKTTVYQYKTVEDYVSQLSTYAKTRYSEEFKPGLTNTTKVLSFDAEQFHPRQDDWGPSYVILPDKLPVGGYLFEAQLTDSNGQAQKAYKFIQVSDLAVYAAANGNDALVWVNDTVTGAPVSGADVTLSGEEGSDAGKTGTDGTVTILYQKPVDDYNDSCRVLTVKQGGKTFTDLFWVYRNNTSASEKSYYTYLYTDRELYLPTDTVQFWGVVRPRQNGADALKNVTAELASGGQILYKADVTVSGDGIYTGSVSFTDLVSSNYAWYTLQVKSGDTVLTSKSIQISDYTKPIYVMSAKPDKEIAVDMEENPVNIRVDCSFFEGTPAANMPISVWGGGAASKFPSSFTLDENGTGSISVTQEQDVTGWRPVTSSFSFTTGEVDNITTTANCSFVSVPRDTMLLTDASVKNNKPTVAVTTNKIDLTGIDTTEKLWAESFPDNIKGAPAEVKVTATAIRHYYIVREDGSYYDFINKQSRKLYHYEPQEEEIGVYTFTTKGGAYTLTDLPAFLQDSDYYELQLRYTDAKGRNVLETCYIGNQHYYNYWSSNIRSFYFQELNAEEKENGDDGWWRGSFTFGEDKDCSLTVSERSTTFAPDEGSRFLTALVQDGTFDVSVDGDKELTVPYKEKLIPNANLVGAYFDGKRIFAVDSSYLSYDPAARELTIQIKTDKTQYRPSDSVDAEILVVDKNNKPVPNADVCLSVVDEAQFAIAPQTVDPLSSIYHTIYYPNITTYVSYTQHDLVGNGAESGGEGGSNGTRSKFVDNAAFLSVKTDLNGKAKATFALADNLTSWRLTAVAVDSRLYAGHTKANVTTKLPMFVSPIVGEAFLAGDTVNFSARTYGTEVKPSDSVSYTATVTGEDYTKTLTVSKKAGENCVFAFDKLAKGEYAVTISGKCGSLSDALQLPFTVQDSGIEARISKVTDFQELSAIDAKRFPVMLGFSNKSYTFFNELLSSLSCTWGRRADQRIASAYANELLAKMSKAENFPSLTDSLDDIRNSNTGVRLLPYSEPDILLTARVAAADPDLIAGDAASELSYTLQNRNTTSEQVSAAYMGLAALHRPVLLELRAILKNPQGFTENDVLRLIAGLALSGDYDGAEQYYTSYIAPKLADWKDAKGETGRYYDSKDQDDVLLTAAASVTASILNKSDAEGMIRYLLQNQSEYDLTVLEQMVYLQYFRPANPEDASFKYTADDGEKTVKLPKRGGSFLIFSKEQLEKANFKSLSGEISVFASYIGGAEELMDNQNKTITVTKSMNSAFETGENVEITLTVEAPAGGCFRIDDAIPSGMRYCGMNGYVNPYSTSPSSADFYAYLSDQEKQRIGFFVYSKFESFSITYRATAVVPGKYIADAPVVTMADGSLWGMGERQTVTVG